MLYEVITLSKGVKLFFAFGAASDKRFSREGDLGADPESVFYLTADKCATNEYFLNKNSFDLYYGAERSLSDDEIYENDYKPTAEELEATRLNVITSYSIHYTKLYDRQK